MSLKTMPLLYLNLGGEMVYVLDLRLRAQGIPSAKSNKLLNDTVATMFDQKFMEELFKPQGLYSRKDMRTVFDRLAHTSIMRLNTSSMSKLYDVMTMAFKYQLSLALRPKDILLVTLNHIDAIKGYVGNSARVKSQVDQVYRMVIETYPRLSNGEFLLIRQMLLNFFQDTNIKVSNLMNDKLQNKDGHFFLNVGGTLPWETEVPGTIRSFDESGKCRNIGFQISANYSVAKQEGSFDSTGNRVTLLGTNMYSMSHSVEASDSSVSQAVDTNNPNPLAKAHLNLLSLFTEIKVTKTEEEG